MKPELFFNNFAHFADAPNGVIKLREMFLQLAVEGKIVAQQINIEPASALLQRIKKDKEKFIKRRNGKMAAAIDSAWGPFIIPENWEWVCLDEITNDVHYGYTAAATHAPTDVKLLRITDIQNGKVNWANVPGCEIGYEKLSGFKLANNDILIARTGGTIGKSYLVQDLELTAVFASYLIRAIPNKNIDAKYIKIFLESPFYWTQLYNKSMGTGQPNVNASSLKSLLLPLPPLEEQERIVAKVDELMRLCDELEAKQHAKCESRARLNNAALAPLNKAASLGSKEFEQATAHLTAHFDSLYESIETVGKLRSTILELAVQGKLVSQDPNAEPAADLLVRIQQRKKELCGDAKIGSVPLSPNPPFKVPHGWQWVRLEQLVESMTNGIYKPSKFYSQTGIACVRMYNIKDGKLDLSKVQRIDLTTEEVTQFRLEPNDIVINRVNSRELVGKATVVPEFHETLVFEAMNIRLRLLERNELPHYINILLRTDPVRSIFQGNAKQAIGQASISQPQVAHLLVPLPPLNEQKLIVGKVNQLMTLCDDLEFKLRETEVHSEKLMNAAVQHVLQTISSADQVNDAFQLSTW